MTSDEHFTLTLMEVAASDKTFQQKDGIDKPGSEAGCYSPSPENTMIDIPTSRASIRHCVVWVDYQSASLSPHPWTFNFGSTFLLKHCIQGIQAMAPCEVLIAAPKTTSPHIKDILATCNVPILWTAFERALPGLHDVASTLGAVRLLAVHGLVGAGLMPQDFLAHFVEQAEKLDGELVVADELPFPLYAHVYGLTGLEFLCEAAKRSALPDSPSAVMDRIHNILQDLPPEAEALRPKRVPTFDRHGITCWPRFIPWERSGDVARLESVLSVDLPQGCSGKLEELRRRIIDDSDSVYHKRRRTITVSRRLRVLYASNPSAYSGAEECLINSIRSLGSRVEAHALVALEGVFTERLRLAGVRVHCTAQDFAAPSVRNNLLMNDLLEEVKPDLVHSNATIGSPLLSAVIVRGLPYLHWLRMSEIAPHDEHLICAHRITVVSSFIAGILCKQMIAARKVRVLYDCVDCDRFSPVTDPSRNIREEYGIPKSAPLILCIGRFARNKRHDVLIDAFSSICRESPDARLLLVGEASAPGVYQRCLAKLHEYGIESKVLLLGFQPDVLSLEKAADVVVLCSEREPLGTVVLESMALGKPVIVAASGGLPEMVDDDVTGLHCVPGDPTSLRDQIWRILRDRHLAMSLGEKARSAAIERFGFSTHANALMAVYDELTSEPASATELRGART